MNFARVFLTSAGVVLAMTSHMTTASGQTAVPANPNASPTARALLTYLAGLSSRTDAKVVSGQFVGHVTPDLRDIDGIHQKSGQWLGMIGADYYGMGPCTATYGAVNTAFIDYWNRGGLVTLTLHMSNPCLGNTGVRLANPDSPEPEISIPTILTTGTAANTKFRTELSRIADGLTQLRNAGVVVLIRPWHEMNGSWFWWGGSVTRRDAANTGTTAKAVFTSLWKYTFDYFTTARGLDNLLWVFSPSSFGTATDWYPGGDCVDIVGFDLYTSSPDVDNGPVYTYNNLVHATGKPFAIGEVGPPSPEADGTYDYARLLTAIKQKFPATVFFQAWGGKYGMDQNLNCSTLLNDPWVVNRAVEFSNTGTEPRAGLRVSPEQPHAGLAFGAMGRARTAATQGPAGVTCRAVFDLRGRYFGPQRSSAR